MGRVVTADEVGKKIKQYFGTINTDAGWRRLNVLFTRAKNRMHIFSSMRPSDITIYSNSKRGKMSLRGFLKYYLPLAAVCPIL